METRTGKALWRVIPVVTLGFVLVACAGQRSRSAEQVHAAWLEALRDNNREQALALVVDTPFKDVQAQSALTMIQNEMRRPVSTSGLGGKLLSVRATRMEARGAGKQGWSRWQYANEEMCHVTDLAQTKDGWRVTDFNLTTKDCGP